MARERKAPDNSGAFLLLKLYILKLYRCIPVFVVILAKACLRKAGSYKSDLNQNKYIMKKPIFMLMAAGLFTFASCDSPAENQAEEQEEVVEEAEDNAEEAADDMEDAADDMDDTTTVVQ